MESGGAPDNTPMRQSVRQHNGVVLVVDGQQTFEIQDFLGALSLRRFWDYFPANQKGRE
jgi:hypothetical protein